MLSGDSLVPLGDFSAQVGNDRVFWKRVIGRNELAEVDLNVVLSLDFCARLPVDVKLTTS